MKRIRFKKDGTNDIMIGRTRYQAKTLDQLLNITTAFYAKVEDEDKDGNTIIVDGPTTKWFNYKGFTYIEKTYGW